ncbi:MAG TPA: hypothetical protein VFC05_02540 [Nitrososphaeraceae archaeon]|jgi:hypothetical protein|nr:hypothetical protein [Nitrososphaeraceae archaeon]
MSKAIDNEAKQLILCIVVTTISIASMGSYLSAIAQEGNIIKLSDISDNFKALLVNNQSQITNQTAIAIESLQNEERTLSVNALENLPRGSTLINTIVNAPMKIYQLEQIGKIVENGLMVNQTS